MQYSLGGEQLTLSHLLVTTRSVDNVLQELEYYNETAITITGSNANRIENFRLFFIISPVQFTNTHITLIYNKSI